MTKRSCLYRMNWGWNGKYNGWFSTFRVNRDDFTYKNSMIYNVRK